MNICVLEHPRIRSEEKFNDIANTPLWSCLMCGYAASSLRQAGHDVCFVDTTINGWDFERTKDEILSLDPDMLCVNAVYFWEYTDRLFDFFNGLRSDGFSGHVSLFGFFPTLAFEAILENISSVDSVVVGECEDTLQELADRLDERVSLEGIKGLAFRTRQGVSPAGHRKPVQDPDRFAFPERVPVPDQTVPDQTTSRTASILASRGCYNHCVFCLVPSFYNNGPLWRGRTPENIYKEMVELLKLGYRDFYFVDPNFIGPGRKNKQRINKLMDLIRPLNITFGMETRPDDLDLEIMDNLVSAGFKSLLLGIESGSSSVLGNLNKSGSVNSSERAINICRDAGIEPQVGFLMFVPDSTLKDLKYNFEFLQKNNLLDRLERTSNLLGHRQIVMMGTSGYGMYEEQGRISRAGALGFEGEVSYRDARVKWISDLMIYACLFVLLNMEKPDSPIFWQMCGQSSEDSPVFAGVNSYLVGLFQRLWDEAQMTKTLPPVAEMKKEIERDVAGRLTI